MSRQWVVIGEEALADTENRSASKHLKPFVPGFNATRRRLFVGRNLADSARRKKQERHTQQRCDDGTAQPSEAPHGIDEQHRAQRQQTATRVAQIDAVEDQSGSPSKSETHQKGCRTHGQVSGEWQGHQEGQCQVIGVVEEADVGDAPVDHLGPGPTNTALTHRLFGPVQRVHATHRSEHDAQVAEALDRVHGGCDHVEQDHGGRELQDHIDRTGHPSGQGHGDEHGQGQCGQQSMLRRFKVLLLRHQPEQRREAEQYRNKRCPYERGHVLLWADVQDDNVGEQEEERLARIQH